MTQIPFPSLESTKRETERDGERKKRKRDTTGDQCDRKPKTIPCKGGRERL